MLGRIEYLDKETFCEIQENLTISQGPLHQIVALECDYIALLFKWHDAKMVEREHWEFVLSRPVHNSMPCPSTFENVD